MDIDWIIGIFVFLIFTGWAFSYYFAIFQNDQGRSENAADAGQEKIMRYVSTDVHEAPVRFESAGAVAGGVLKAKSIWYSGEKNSTMVFAGGSALPCRIDGDDLYWQADLSDGPNYFTIVTAGINTTMNCTGTFSISSFNITIPWALEKSSMVSMERINSMMNASYAEFRDSLGIRQNFRFTLERAGEKSTYGKSIPSGAVNVNSKKTRWRIYETMEEANITVAVW